MMRIGRCKSFSLHREPSGIRSLEPRSFLVRWGGSWRWCWCGCRALTGYARSILSAAEALVCPRSYPTGILLLLAGAVRLSKGNATEACRDEGVFHGEK